MTGADRGPAAPSRLVQGKLVFPDLDERLVPRPRLDADIAHLLDHHPALVVAAAAGAGKTVAVAQALLTLGRRVAWVRLDTSDRAAGRLLVYLEAAVGASWPAAGSRATAALRDGAPLTEAAALLAESLAGADLVLVCDNVERVDVSPEAMAVLSAIARYLPPATNLVLVSRRSVALTAMATNELGRTGVLDAELLPFRASEAHAALDRRSLGDIDVERALSATGGWVAGVLFYLGSPRSADGERALSSYLYEHVWLDLDEDSSRFLLRTAVLEDVSAVDAAELGEVEPALTMDRLRARHLPVTWAEDGRRLTLHPQFREFVTAMLVAQDAPWRTEVQRRHVALLLARGRSEDAVEVLLELGDLDEAWRHAVDALPLIIERMDLTTAARWLDALDVVRRPPGPQVSTVVLRVAFGLEQYRRGATFWDVHGPKWVRGLVRDDALEPVVLLVWCLWHLGRLSEANDVAATLPGPGWHRRVAETVLALSEDDPPPFPEVGRPRRPGPLEGLLRRVAYSRGRLAWVREANGQGGPWREAQGAPWRIAALRAAGRLDEALAEWELRRGTVQPLWLDALDGVELLLDAGRDDEAREALARGHYRARVSGSQIYRILVQIQETRVHLRGDYDLGAARRALSRAEALGAHDHAFTRDLAALCHGSILLRESRAEAAEATLGRCVESMRQGDRLLELPAAACYLAEAQARRGGPRAQADAAESTALALQVADDRGSEALLLAALADVPDVAIRAANASAADPRWRVLADRVTGAAAGLAPAAAPRVVLEEFGTPELRIDGRVVVLRRRKEFELLAFLLSRPDQTARREELLDALFSGREDRASASYLRQCLHRVRALLPDGVDLERDHHLLRLVPRDAAAGTSGELVAPPRRPEVHGDSGRRGQLLSSLEAADRGRFLDGISGSWVEERRREVADLVARRRLEAASLSIEAGDVATAEHQIDRVLADDPYREQAWQVRLTVDGATGDHDRLIEHYRSYLTVMRDLGMGPSAEMHRLVETIRAGVRDPR